VALVQGTGKAILFVGREGMSDNNKIWQFIDRKPVSSSEISRPPRLVSRTLDHHGSGEKNVWIARNQQNLAEARRGCHCKKMGVGTRYEVSRALSTVKNASINPMGW
jgi:cytolysin (calcineurin-like family phosphatase)